MKKTILFAFLAVLMSAPIFAGVVFNVETIDHSGSEPVSTTTEVWAAGDLLKTTISGDSEEGDMIFRGAQKEMVVVNHGENSYFVVDETMVESIGGQLNQAMKQMEEALKNVPPEQRAMVENMMKQNMPQMAGPTKPKAEVRKTSERKTEQGYPCVKYEVFEGDKRVRELWVTDWDNVEGGSEVAASFRSMADFFEGLLDSLSSMSGLAEGVIGQLDVGMVSQLSEIDGFPVVTRAYDDNGDLSDESILRSAERQQIDPASFEPPAGYKLQQLFQ